MAGRSDVIVSLPQETKHSKHPARATLIILSVRDRGAGPVEPTYHHSVTLATSMLVKAFRNKSQFAFRHDFIGADTMEFCQCA
jgi:hypothetical protein